MAFQKDVPFNTRRAEEIARETPVTVMAVTSAEQAEQLAQFAKRVRFDTAYALTEAHLAHEERERRAHLMLGGIEAVAHGLAETGYRPR